MATIKEYLLKWLVAMLCAFCLSECASQKQTWFESSFQLTAFLKNHVTKPRTKIVFQVCNAKKEPFPHGLLRFDWVDNGGRMSFQTDDKGRITMRFEEDILASDILVSIDQKPLGQDLMKTENYEASTQQLTDGFVLVSWQE